MEVVPSGPTWGDARAKINQNFDEVSTALAGKQATLSSGTNIKTLNGASMLGAGNITLNEMAPIATDSIYANVSGGTVVPVPKTFAELNLVRTTAGKLPEVDGSQLTNTPLLAGDVYNVRNYGASGEGDVVTDGDITSGTNSLINVGSTATFKIGQGIAIYGAGTIGVNSKILATVITNIVGSTITLRDNASHTVVNAVVKHSDHEAIQNCINAALYPGNSEVARCKGYIEFPAGIYVTHKPIHIGYGETLKSAHIRGAGIRYSGTWPFMGTAILSENGGEPVFTVNGSRMGIIEGITFRGLNRQWIEDNQLGMDVATEPDLLTSDWVDADVLADFPNCNSRYAPYCAVAVDPYAGARPGTSYPDMVIPGWMALGTQYNRNAKSSQVTFEQCSFEGFILGVGVHVSNTDGNGDFMTFNRCLFNCLVYGVSWGNTQARLFSLDDCVFGRVHTCVTTVVHGQQNGKPDLLAKNTAFEGTMRWFYMPNLSYGGTPTFKHCRGELIYRIGDGVVSAFAAPGPINFEQCEFNFGWQVHGCPSDIITNLSPTNFRGCHFAATVPENPDYAMAIPFDVPDHWLSIDGCTLVTGYNASLYSQKIAINACGGLLTKNLGVNLAKAEFTNMTRWDLNSGIRLGYVKFSEEEYISNRQTCVHVYAKRINCFGLETEDSGMPRSVKSYAIAKSGWSYSISGRVLTISDIPANTYRLTFKMKGGAPGDLVYDDETKTFFVVQSWSFTDTGGGVYVGTLKLFALTNYTPAPAVRTTPTNTGYLWILLSRVYTPSYPIFGDLTSGNATISNVQDGNGTNQTAHATDTYQVNDFYQVLPYLDNSFNELNNHITATASGSITIGLTANYTQTKKRLTKFVRVAPTNDT